MVDEKMTKWGFQSRLVLEELAIKMRKLESNLTNQERTLIIVKKETNNILAQLKKH